MIKLVYCITKRPDLTEEAFSTTGGTSTGRSAHGYPACAG
jgi:hypothetical protein